MNIAFFGLGKLGLPLATLFANSGLEVQAVDRDKQLVSDLKNQVLPFHEPGLQEIFSESFENFSTFTTDGISAVVPADVILVLVNTQDREGGYSAGNVEGCIDTIAKGLALSTKAYPLVILSSTVPPFTISSLIKQLEECSGRKYGESFGFSYVPDFVKLGSVLKDFSHPDFFLVGANLEKDFNLSHQIFSNIHLNSPSIFKLNFSEAEIAKVILNTYVVVKISFANYVGLLCDSLPDVNPASILSVVGSDTRISNKFFAPGTPYGGTCFPRDTAAFSQFARTLNADCKIIDFCEDVNTKLLQLLYSKGLPYDSIGIIGVSFKESSPVIQGSPSLELINLFIAAKKNIYFYDPLVSRLTVEAGHTLTSEKSIDDLIHKSEAIFLMHKDKSAIPPSPTHKAIIDPWHLV